MLLVACGGGKEQQRQAKRETSATETQPAAPSDTGTAPAQARDDAQASAATDSAAGQAKGDARPPAEGGPQAGKPSAAPAPDKSSATTPARADPAQEQPAQQPKASATAEEAGQKEADAPSSEPAKPAQSAPSSYDPLADQYKGKLPQKQSVIEVSRQQAFTELKTYAPDLDDKAVMINNLQPWVAKKAEYAGRYKGPLDGELTEITFYIDRYNHLLGRLNYHMEVVTESGMLEPKRGNVKMPYSKLDGTILRWPPVDIRSEQIGQFVEWTNKQGEQQQGFITYSKPDKQQGYTLLRKTN
jgi:hypothetical protein